jgi:hypothetical protein
MTRKLVSHLALAFAAASTLTLAACETPAPPPPPVVAAPVAPPIALASNVIQQASAYQTYVRQASNISPAFNNGTAVQASLRQGAAYEPAQLASGQIAYAAIVALQDPTFVAAVREFAADPQGRIKVRDSILRDPAYVVGFKGSDTAAGLVVTALNGEGARVRGVGQLVKQAAYSVQHQAWSKVKIPDPELRLSEAKTLSSTQITPASIDAERLASAALGQAPLTLEGRALPPPYTPVVIRGMAIAALAALGEGGEANAAYLDALMNDPNNGRCLKYSKLNLYQCLAVAKPWYEDVFCLGQHVLIDTGQCIASAAGDLPPQPVLIPTAAPAAPLQTPIPTDTAKPLTSATSPSPSPSPVAVSADVAAKPAIAMER